MVNFIDIIESTEAYNFHTHTQYCDGHDVMEAFVKEAISIGFKHLGFTPHGPTKIQSTCNMSSDAVNDYMAEVNRLRHVYGEHIYIYAGMEVDYIDADEFRSLNSMSWPLDYRIGSVHFIPSFDNPEEFIDIDGRFEKFKEKMKKFFHDDIESVVRSYYHQSMEMIQTGGFDIVGHFDKIGLNARLYCEGIDEQPWYDRLVMDLFEAIMDYGYIVEINTKSWLMYNRFFPNLKYFGMLKKYNAPVVINSDAHYPTLLDSGRIEAIRLFSH